MLVILRHVSASNSRVPSNLDPPSKGTVMRQSGFKSITAKMPFFLSLFLGAQDFRLLILLSYTSVCRSVCDFGKAYSTMVMQTFKMHPCKDLYFSRSPLQPRGNKVFLSMRVSCKGHAQFWGLSQVQLPDSRCTALSNSLEDHHSRKQKSPMTASRCPRSPGSNCSTL